MLTAADLKKLLSAGPGPRIDILTPNSATAERMARSLVSLANAQGGVLLVPLHAALSPKSRSASSAVDGDELRDRAMQAALMSEPRLIIPLPYVLDVTPATETDPAHSALVVEVPDGMSHVYSLDGRYLTRNNARVTPLAARALRELLLVRGEGTWEAMSPTGSSQDDLNWSQIDAYAASTLNAGEPTVEDLMLRRGCVIRHGRKLKPTYAGLLLFGKQPQRWVRGAEVLAVRFNGTSMDDVFTRQTLGSTLPDQIKRAEQFMSENVPRKARIGAWQRSDDSPYPSGVLREAVVNAIAHRDYRLTGSQVHILMFADRVEVRSPGKLPGHVTLQNLLHERYSRNESIVQVLADMGFIERLGYGIDRMVRTMKERGHQPPRFEETDAGFCVTLFARSGQTSAADTLPQPAQTQRVEKMLDYLRDKGRITSRDYQELCPDVSAESLRRDFVDMVERGVIMRVGDKRGTYYILK